MGWLGSEVAHHPSVDDVAEVSLEDAHGFLLGVAAAAGVVVDLSCAWFAAQLCNCDSVQAGVDASVAAAVEAMPDGCAVSFGAGGGEWGAAVETGEAAGAGESAGVTDFDEELGLDPFGDAAQLVEG